MYTVFVVWPERLSIYPFAVKAVRPEARHHSEALQSAQANYEGHVAAL